MKFPRILMGSLLVAAAAVAPLAAQGNGIEQESILVTVDANKFLR